ncbi:ribonucleases p/mrp protein subunit pop1 [Anaeramoeba flamelloides]|uniref:Ribonucleases p/mrp protein subunit pop1 n=1 Tax=Anaeramoeba flamelloides TaxID=1746091 RepID=A0ABQ8YFE4_9EUKA|nr:ribonucleases p/mrp protein subunit pop1 [Anaeramoeba flamelloides]
MSEYNPTLISLNDFLNSRTKELKKLRSELNTRRGNCQLTQTLPKHLRRRTMSHDIHRVPHRMRKHIEKEMGKNPPRKSKLKSRQSRRKPNNMLKEYERRSKKHVWLETHIWHAKRMHMHQLFGYKLAYRTNEKLLRGCYKLAARSSVIYDESYYQCYECVARQQNLITFFSQLIDKQSGFNFKTIGNRLFLRGNRQGSSRLILDREKKVVCPFRFIWDYIPFDSNIEEYKNKTRKIWIWVHPACRTLLVDLINSKNINNDISFHELENQPCRFSIIGPSSINVLQKVLWFDFEKEKENENEKEKKKENEINKEKEINKGDDMKPETETETETETEMKIEEEESGLLKRTMVWKSLKKINKPASLLEGCILSLDVINPKEFTVKRAREREQEFQFNQKNLTRIEKAKYEKLSKKIQYKWCSELSKSKLWDKQTRKKLLNGIERTNKKIDDEASKKLFPNVRSSKAYPNQKIPVLIVQTAGSKALGFGSGFDVIIPKGYAKQFWVALVHSGAVPIGMRERHRIETEAGRRFFPDDFIEAPSFYQSATKLIVSEKESQKWVKTHKGKRVNYKKFGINSPFFPDFSSLLKSSTNNNNPKNDDDNNTNTNTNNNSNNNNSTNTNQMQATQSTNTFNVEFVENINSLNTNTNSESFIPITITAIQKGSLKRNAHLYFPTKDESNKITKKLKFNQKWSKNDNHCLVGFITTGMFSLARGCGFAIGFIRKKDLIKNQNACKNSIILVRNTNGAIFYPAKFEFCKN